MAKRPSSSQKTIEISESMEILPAVDEQEDEDIDESELDEDEILDLDDDEILVSKSYNKTFSTREKEKSDLPVSTSGSRDVVKLDLLQKYFKELRNYPLLTKEEEYDLASQFQETRDPKIAFRLTTSNLRLVVKIAMEYQSAANNLLDLIQEGNVGLMQAVDKYDPFRGIRLSSYAQWWIRAYILKFLVNNARMVKLGTTQAQRKLFFNLKKEKDKLEALGFKPETKLLAERLDVKESEVIEMEQRLSAGDLSLDAPLGDEGKSTVGDLFASNKMDIEESVIQAELLSKVRDSMKEFGKTLKDRELTLWEKRLASEKPVTLQEIGDLYGVTRERARQIEKDVSNKFEAFLKKRVTDLDAEDFLPD